MISLLLKKIGNGVHLWTKSLFHVRCDVRILNLIVKDGLEVIKVSFEKIRDSVAFWTATPRGKRSLKMLSTNRTLLMVRNCLLIVLQDETPPF